MFYNPAMAVDRDIAVALLAAWAATRPRPLDGWDALAATGVRGLRLIRETSGFRRMVLTETNPLGLLVLSRNAERYRALGAEAYEHDARKALAEDRFDFVDLDPFGTPVEYVDSALTSLHDGGLLGVAATDMPVLAGVERGAAERRYGAGPLRGRLAPEGGLRILLAFLARRSAERNRSVHPVLSYVHDHHVRTYVEVRPARDDSHDVGEVDASTWEGPWLGTGRRFGPLWVGRLYDVEVVQRMRTPSTAQDPAGAEWYLRRFQEESRADYPFYYEPNELARRTRSREPVALSLLLETLHGHGWSAERTHARPAGFRTNAPRSVVEGFSAELASRPRNPRQSQNARVRA